MTIVRKTTGNDQETIYRLVREAFASAAVSDGNEVNLVNALEKSPSWIPELSLVAEKEGILVGYILFTQAMVGQTEILALAPLAVLPSQQGHGIGRTLIEKGHQKAKELGYAYVAVLGDPAYYSRFGYGPAADLGIKAPPSFPTDYFMAIQLDGSARSLDGSIIYDAAFGIS